MPLTDHVADGRVCGVVAVSVLAVSILAETAALIVHAAALELTEQVEEAVLIGGVAAQLLLSHTEGKSSPADKNTREAHKGYSML